MAYGFSVFWLPLSKAIGITKPVACPATAGLLDYLTTTSCDWKVALLQSWVYGLFFVFLGSSAALWGGWLELVGPRKAGIVAAFCWCVGILVMAFGVARHQLWIVWLGAASGGVGLGLGYISPVSTLIKMYILAALLALGFLCNLLVRPVAAKNYMTPAQLAQLDAEQHLVTRPATAAVAGDGTPSPGWLVAAAWLAVGIPIAWGVWVTLQKAVILFGL
jgi:hypothetical protein